MGNPVSSPQNFALGAALACEDRDFGPNPLGAFLNFMANPNWSTP